LLEFSKHFKDIIFKLAIWTNLFLCNKWLTNPCVGCWKLANLASICEIKYDLIEELDVEFVNKVEREEFIDVHNAFYRTI
jgi:hypothetical protein